MKEFQEAKAYEEEHAKEIEQYLKDVDDMLKGKGEHSYHTQEKIGRCIYCSCGMRVQAG